MTLLQGCTGDGSLVGLANWYRIASGNRDYHICGDADRATFTNICEQSDETLFNSIKRNVNHLLYPLLPQERSQHYSLRQRSHNFQIPLRTSALYDNNFINRMLFIGLNYNSDSQL